MTTKIPIPLYTFMLKDGSGTVFLRAGSELFIPFFTSAENASLYKEREKLDCIIVQLATREDIRDYVESPPSRSASETEFRLMIDPVDSDVGDYTVFDREQLLAAIQ